MKLRVIVLEDDDASRMLIVMVMEKRGYEVISAPDPTSCPIYTNLEEPCLHEDGCCDFLLTDNQMPRMTGLEFIDAQSRRGCKVIVNNKAIISASWRPKELEKAEKLGCKTFSKPYNIAEISKWFDEQEQMIPPDRKLVVLDTDLGQG